METSLRQTIAVHSGDGSDLEGLLSLLQRLTSGIQTRLESFGDEDGRFRCEINGLRNQPFVTFSETCPSLTYC